MKFECVAATSIGHARSPGQRNQILTANPEGTAIDRQEIEEIAPNPWDIRVFRVEL
jgi:hypothetical protein